MAVASSPGPLNVNGRPTCGFFYALSADLIHWTTHRLLVEASLSWCAADPAQPGVLEPVIVAHPSIVDHADTTVNFENAGRTPYFYYVRVNGNNLDRDVVRVPLTLTRENRRPIERSRTASDEGVAGRAHGERLLMRQEMKAALAGC
jgi:hypothetical protein